MGFFDDLADHLESNLSLFGTFKIDVLGADDNTLTLRRYQSASPSSKFLDGSYDNAIGIQVLVRNLSQKTAIDTIEAITEHMVKMKEGDLIASDGSYQFISFDIYVNPLLVEKTDHDAYLYQVMLYGKLHKS